MESAPFPRRKWKLTQDAFDLLLAQLDADRHEAGKKYEVLRRKLIKFFEWRGCSFPEDLADETFNRVTKSLDAGEHIRHFAAYCAGTARNVFLESLRTRRQEEQAFHAMPCTSVPPLEDFDHRTECLENCVGKLSPEDFQLIMQYYQEDTQARIAGRQSLAAQLGIPVNALRIRAHRIRIRLEDCVEECMRRPLKERNI